MASTYSSKLNLELITTGEKAGTWGTITNTNIHFSLKLLPAAILRLNIINKCQRKGKYAN